jgi:hypothetical protein
MKVQQLLRIVRFCLPVVVVVVWGGATLTAQEKPKTLLLWQNGGIGQRDADTAHLIPTQERAALKLKSPNTAYALSLTGYYVPVIAATVIILSTYRFDFPFGPDPDKAGTRRAADILLLSGAIFGPSAGYFYGGCADRACNQN